MPEAGKAVVNELARDGRTGTRNDIAICMKKRIGISYYQLP